MYEGKVIGERYLIEALLGQGGMATVFRGQDTLEKRPVAIKLLKRDVIEASANSIERFDRESQILRRLNHPNIVTIYATVQDGLDNFVIMELVTGGDLGDLLKQEKRLSIERTLEIALDLCDALTRAHRLQVIHRDIKPANVLIAEDGTPRLSDFGVAHLGDSTRITKTGTMIGTLAYLSPEACMGESVDARSDIWAFGVMLYEMLTGFRPFMDASSAALLTAILSRPVPPIEKLRPEIPLPLANLIYSMLEKDRDDRISSIRRVGAVLEAIMDGRDPDDISDIESEAVRAVQGEDLSPSMSRPKTPTEMLGELKQAAQSYHTPPKTPSSPVASAAAGANLDLDYTMPPEEASAAFARMSAEHDPASTSEGQSPAYAAARRRFPTAILLALVLLVAVVGVGLTVVNRGAGILTVAEVSEGNYMVLVSEIERIGGASVEPSRFIVEDLKRSFEETYPFSKVEIRAYPGVITSEAQAAEVAQVNNASLVIWGNTDGSITEVNLQVGVLAENPFFTQEAVAQSANVTVRMTDPRTQSLTAQAVAIINQLASVDSDILSVGGNLAILERVAPQSPEIVGSTAASYWHRFLANYFVDPQMAYDMASEAIRLDAGFPIYYLGRSLIAAVIENPSQAEVDIRTAGARAPQGWMLPISTRAQHELIVNANAENARRQMELLDLDALNDGHLFFLRAGSRYMLEDYAGAQADLERSLALDDSTNLPYSFLAGLALRSGDLQKTQEYVAAVRERFPDPTYGERLISSAYGVEQNENSIAGTLTAFGHLSLFQWQDAIESADAAISTGQFSTFVEPYVVKGIAQCNLRDYAGAEATYTRMLEIAPDYWFAYALRAEVRARQGNLIGAAQDGATLASSPQADKFMPLIPALTQGEGGLNCENFLEVDLSTLLGTSDGGN